jgi:ribonuclease P/MRP protein subunit POP8
MSDAPITTDQPTRLKSHSNTLRRPQWTYFHLSALRMESNPAPLDIITVRQNLSSAMARFLGFMGTTIDMDILKCEGDEVWVRVPRGSSKAFHEAIVSWTSPGEQMKYIVKGRDDWLVRLAMGSGQDLFGQT